MSKTADLYQRRLRYWSGLLPPDYAQAQAGYEQRQAIRRGIATGLRQVDLAAFAGFTPENARKLFCRAIRTQYETPPIDQYFKCRHPLQLGPRYDPMRGLVWSNGRRIPHHMAEQFDLA